MRSVKPNSCQAEALVAIHTNIAGKVPYELECGVGRSWRRTIKSSVRNLVAVDKVRFQTKHNERINCILRSRIDRKIYPLSGTNRLYRCLRKINRRLDGQSNQNVQQPKRIQCIGGRAILIRIRNMERFVCRCSQGYRVRRVRRDVFRCIRQQVAE